MWSNEEERVPVERLLENVQAYQEEHGSDPMTTYLVGRIEYLAFHQKNSERLVLRARLDRCAAHLERHPHDKTDKPAPPVDHCDKPSSELADDHRGQDDAEPALDRDSNINLAELERHLRSAVHYLHQAIEAGPPAPISNALFHLTLASALEEGAPLIYLVDSRDVLRDPTSNDHQRASDLDRARDFEARVAGASESDKLRLEEAFAFQDPCAARMVVHRVGPDWQQRPLWAERCMRDQAMNEYSVAFELAYNEEISSKHVFDYFSYPMAAEAGEGFIRLLLARGVQDSDRPRLAELRKRIKEIYARVPRAQRTAGQTPIIFSLTECRSLSELLSNHGVNFDLTGGGSPRFWSWVRPGTGLLVWDPTHKGHVDSGRELFGNVTFHMFWSDGYAALDALDNNRDGVLTAGELAGLAVWFDRNSNGVADPGEVLPLEDLGITGLATQSTSVEGEARKNARGLFLRDGRALPTWDWVAHVTPIHHTAGGGPQRKHRHGIHAITTIPR
jgi:hypothetical protein